MSPLIRMFISSDKCSSSEFSIPMSPIKSFRCYGRNPSGPPADPAGNVRMASRVDASVECSAVWLGRAGGLMSAGVGGCRSCSLPRFIALAVAIVSDEQKSRMAPFTSPSSNFAAARFAIVSLSSKFLREDWALVKVLAEGWAALVSFS